MKMILLPLPATDRRLLRGVVAALVFIVSLLALVSLSSGLILARWHTDLRSQVSFVLRAESMSDGTNQLRQLQTALADEAAIASIKPLGEAAVAELLAPWRPQDAATDNNWPLPVVVDITLRPTALAVAEDLVARWQQAMPQWQVTWHSSWAQQVRQGIGLIMAVLIGMVALITAMLLLVMIMVARTRLRLQKPQIELLRILGSEDHYIRRQLLRPLMLDIRTGCLYGWLAHLSMVILLTMYAMMMWPVWYGNLLPLVSLRNFMPWPYMFALLAWPLVVLGLCYLTLRQTLSNLLKDLG